MAPIVYDGYANTGYAPSDGVDKFGALGAVSAITVHHSAGPRAYSKARAIQLHKAYQAQHVAQGYGDIGYHFALDDHGRFYKLRPIKYKGAHVGGWNTGNVGLMVHGNYQSDKLTRAQKDSLKWLFRGGLLVLTGHREAEYAIVRGHQEWPSHTSNACPGVNLMRYWRYLRNEEH